MLLRLPSFGRPNTLEELRKNGHYDKIGQAFSEQSAQWGYGVRWTSDVRHGSETLEQRMLLGLLASLLGAKDATRGSWHRY